MTIESTPNPEQGFLGPREFLQVAIGRLGVPSVAELTIADKAAILLAFHIEECDRDGMLWRDRTDVPQALKNDAYEELCIRGVVMRTLAELLIGFDPSEPIDWERERIALGRDE